MDEQRTSIKAAVGHPTVRDTLTTQLRFYFPQITGLEFGDAEVVVVSDDPVPQQKLERAASQILDRFTRIPRGARTRVLLDAADGASVEAWLARPARFPTAVLTASAARLADDLA